MRQSSKKTTLNRQEFLRLASTVGLAAALSAFLEACTSPEVSTPTIYPTGTYSPNTPTTRPAPTSTATMQPTETATSMPTAIPESEKARVAFVVTDNRADGVRKAIDLLEINPVSGKSVFLKPNLNSSDPAPASTHPDVLRASIGKLREMGAQEISLGDRSGMGSTQTVMKELGIVEMGSELGFEVIDFSVMGPDQWKMIRPEDSHWRGGFPFARPCLQTDTIVQTCCLKTHGFGGHFTMSLKNSVGMVADYVEGFDNQFMDELHSSNDQRKMIAEINTAYDPALIILDGVEAFTSGGPHEGRLAAPEVVLAGTDRIAIDAVGVALLRYFKTTAVVAQGPIFEQQQIARAAELGLGIANPDEIQLITGDSKSSAFADKIEQVLLEF